MDEGAATVIDAEAPGLTAVSLVYGFFHTWKAGAAGDTLVIESKGHSSVEVPGDLTLAAHPGWFPDTTQWRPLLVRAMLPRGKHGEPAEEALVVWPPSRENQPLTLDPAPYHGINREAPPLLARSPSGDRVADALFAYVRGGRLDLARQAVPAFAAQAERFLYEKYLNPIHAILAAYTLQKVGGDEHSDWLSNLAHSFQYLPDGALLYGWYLIRAGRAPEAKEFFRTALARGVPMYSLGVRLLRDGLSFLRGLEPEDADIKTDTARAFRLAAAINPSSELTCLRLGGGLGVELA
jgi:hypothetical protein